ncbi:hypothetical protein C922_02738 [Plasmodium inui San Antonio 1]|uniref:Adenosinetriphosphatase n=1 Tax=Plasmodium inui San Antonio 1 TaxID=1237626 RepID=W7A6A9_9APIC|nr:hypothetical protein C922_02738 [Plasmodium inui San Antonio 1]EUD66753.1 hypothetical protein C922_02738 [Plasmodium inui San Antonio 1]
MDKADGYTTQRPNVAESGKNPIGEGEKGASSFCELHMEGMVPDRLNEHVTGVANFAKEDNIPQGGETPTLVVHQDGDTFELTSPVPLHKSDTESSGENERKEPEGEVDNEEYLYVSEHLRIKKDKQIFVSTALNDYINEHLNFFSSCEEKFFRNENGEAERFMEIGLNLKYLRYRDRMKRRKRRLVRRGGREASTAGASTAGTYTAAISTVEATTGEKSPHRNGTSSDSSSLFSNSSSEEDPSDNSPCTSDEDILEKLHFDKESLRTMKKLERSKNAYFKYLSDLCIKHDMMSRFNLPYLERVKRAIRKSPSAYKGRRDRSDASIEAIQIFLENEENARMIALSQKRLRSDVVNSMFGFHIISDTHPMKLPIKSVNRLCAGEARSSMIKSGITTSGIITSTSTPFAYKSLQSTKRVGPAKQSGNASHGEGGTKRRRRQGWTKGYSQRNRSPMGGGNLAGRNHLNEYIKKVQSNSKLHNEVGTIKEYILLSNWNELRRHHHTVRVVSDQRRSNAHMLANECYNQMKLIEKKRKIIIEREEKERLRLLKENDMDAYMNLLRKTKNKRLQEMLDVTEEFLTNMSSCVLCQKKDNPFDVPSRDEPSSIGSNEMDSTHHSNSANIAMKSNYKDAREKYLLVSHSVREKVVQPSILIGGTLMKYQLEGLEWLISLYNNNLHGILADEMGLGKTIQTISLFAYLKEFKWGGISSGNEAPPGVGGHKQPKNLIIVPLSTLPNWTSEFEAWCPALKVITYKGTKCERKGLAKQLLESEYDICLTTFDFAIKEKALLLKIFWTYIVVDEGHRMKNCKSRFHLILKDFKSKQRVLLTGTPLQNNLSELWSLLNFLLPKIFSSCEDFERWFIRPLHNDKELQDVVITEEEQLLIINRLHSVLLPFMLRRVKKDVLKSLPKKYEYNVHIDLSLYQKMLYRQMEMKGFTQINKNGSISNKSCQNMVMQLRKVVNHPYLFLEEYNIDEYLIKCSGKFEVLDRMLPKLLKFRHKTLIFSQMTKLMDILCDYLDYRGHRFHRLDGNIGLQERRKMIETFNRVGTDGTDVADEPDGVNGEVTCAPVSEAGVDQTGEATETSYSGGDPAHSAEGDPLDEPNGGHDETMIFMLSTRSGSLGLNLQTADTVIIFDSDFNPHQDIQAMCRCHRIGQKNVVKVFRFITLSGVEELIFQKAQDKLTINDKVIQAGLFNRIYSDEDRKEKLKNIFQRSQKGQVTLQSTNPLLLNYYMERSDVELKYFLKFDERYFGSEFYTHLESLNREKPDVAQFTYMSEDEGEESGRQGSGEVGSGEVGIGKMGIGDVGRGKVESGKVESGKVPPDEPRIGEAPSWAEERSAILKEENQSEIEKVLIKSKKLVNGDELPSYLFYDDTDDGIEVEFKRTRRQINVHLMDEENLSNVEFLQLIGSGVDAEEGAKEGAKDEARGEALHSDGVKEREIIEKAKGEGAGNDPTNGDSINGDPANGDPLNDDPANGDPTNGDPTDGDPKNGDPPNDNPANERQLNDDPLDDDSPGARTPLGAHTTERPHRRSSRYNFRRSGTTEQTHSTRNGRTSEGRSPSPQRGKRKSSSPGEVRLNQDKKRRKSRG